MLSLGIFVNLLNIILAAAIVVFGYKIHKINPSRIVFYISLAFAFLGFSDILYAIIDFFGLHNIMATFTSALGWASFVVVVRIIAYALVGFALYTVIED